MSLYSPPNEILPIFNPINYDLPGNTDPNDIPFLTGYFTRYPVSQGSQTISGTLVSTGQVTAQTNIVMSGTPATNYIEFPDGTKQYTAGGGAGTLSSVLTAGNTATNSITLDNLGAGNNDIRILPNFGSNNTHIELSDGTVPNTNKITKNGYTTHNSNENQTRYLTFSESFEDTTGEIRKSDKIVVNPFLGTFSATGLVTATGGLTTGTGSVLTSTGTTALGGATTANALITANGGLTTGEFSTLTSTGTTTLGGATTATELITANGGLTMGGTRVITLGTGATAPGAGQLGEIVFAQIKTSFTISGVWNANTSIITPDTPLSVGPGVWWVIVAVSYATLAGATVVTVPVTVLSVDRGNTGSFQTENTTFCPRLRPSATPAILESTANISKVFHFTTSDNIITVSAGKVDNGANFQTQATANYSYLKVVRMG